MGSEEGERNAIAMDGVDTIGGVKNEEMKYLTVRNLFFCVSYMSVNYLFLFLFKCPYLVAATTQLPLMFYLTSLHYLIIFFHFHYTLQQDVPSIQTLPIVTDSTVNHTSGAGNAELGSALSVKPVR